MSCKGKEIKSMTVQEIVDRVMNCPEKSKNSNHIFPVVRGKKGRHEKVLEAIKKEGYLRVRINGEAREITENIELDKNKKFN